MKSLMLPRLVVGALLLVAGLTLVSAEELVGTPVPIGDGATIYNDMVEPDVVAPAPPSPPDWKTELDKGLSDVIHDIDGDKDSTASLNFPVESEWAQILAGFAVFIILVLVLGWPFFLSIYLVTLHYRAKSQRQRDLNANIDKLLAAGRDIPVEILRGDEPRRPDESGNRDKGIRNLFLGTGWLIFLTIFFGIDIGAIGFIWIALGASQLVIWKLNNPAPGAQPQAGQQD